MSAWLAVHASHRALGVAVVAAFVAIGCAAGGGATIAPSTTSPSAVPSTQTHATPGPTTSTGSGYGSRYGNRPTPSPAAATRSIVVKTVMASLGAVLVGPNGLTLYTHDGDTSKTSTCTGGCA